MKTFLSIIVIFIIVGLSIALYVTNVNLNKERAARQTQQDKGIDNYNALKDSISVEFSRRLKAWEFSKENLLLEKISDLEKYNKDLYDQIKKVKGDVIAAIKTDAQANLGGISTTNGLTVIDPLTNHYGLNFKTEYKDIGFEQKLVGTSRFYVNQDFLNKKWIISPDITVIDTNLTSIKITYGFKELDDKYHIFAISQSPKVQLNELNGSFFLNKQPTVLPQKPKKWGIGPYFGVGMNTGTKNVIGASVGISVHYDFYQFDF